MSKDVKNRVFKQVPSEPRTKTPDQAFNSLMHLCSRAEKSSGDAFRLMYRWGVDKSAQADVLEKLKQNKFIDDERFAAAFVRDKINFAGWGVYKICEGLRAKGISKEIIDQEMSHISSDDSEKQLAEILERKARKVKYTDIYDLKIKLVRYGASRGFEYDMVFETVEKLVNSNLFSSKD